MKSKSEHQAALESLKDEPIKFRKEHRCTNYKQIYCKWPSDAYWCGVWASSWHICKLLYLNGWKI